MKIKMDYLELFALGSISVLLITFSNASKSGAADGIALCEGIIIPSLLPILIIFNLIMKTNAGRILDNSLSFVIEKVFRLPKCASSAVLFGLIGGYPTGAILTESLFDNNDIDEKTARRLLRFNVNGGAAFIITAVGSIILKNQKAGIILFASTTLSALIIAFLTSLKCEKISGNQESFLKMKFGEALNLSVEASLKSILKMSSYIIIFSAISNIIKVPLFLTPLIEITNGMANAHSAFSLPELAFLLSFSGLCIHLQLFSIIKKFKMRYFDFFIWRIAHSALSYFICMGLTALFPTEAAVFSNITEIAAKASYLNSTLSGLLIVGCAVIVFDIESKKKRC